MYWTETTCLGSTESKSLHADFSVPLLHSLTQKVDISLASAPITHNLAEGGHKKEGWVWGRHDKAKGRLKGLHVVKGTKQVYPVCEMARWGLGYNSAASTAQPTPKEWSAFNAPWQGELPLQEGMLLLSLHQIFQHCLHNFQTTGLVLFPFSNFCHRWRCGHHPPANIVVTLSWWFENEHTCSQAPNSSGLETSSTQILLHLSNIWLNCLQTRPVLSGSTHSKLPEAPVCNYLSEIWHKRP